MGISEHTTVDWRRQNNIPDSDGFELGLTRKRSDTAHSDSHDQERNRLEEIAEVYIAIYVNFCCACLI
jgi:hypothetical protein